MVHAHRSLDCRGGSSFIGLHCLCGLQLGRSPGCVRSFLAGWNPILWCGEPSAAPYQDCGSGSHGSWRRLRARVARMISSSCSAGSGLVNVPRHDGARFVWLRRRARPLAVTAWVLALAIGSLACEVTKPVDTNTPVPTTAGVPIPRPTTVPTPTLPEGWRRYQNPILGYSILHPTTWTTEERPSVGATEFYSPKGINCNVGVGRTRETDVERYVAANRIRAEEGAKYLSEGPIELNGRQGRELVMTLPSGFYGFRGDDRLLIRQVLFVARGNAYVVACTAFEDEASQYGDTFSTIINSFIITPE